MTSKLAPETQSTTVLRVVVTIIIVGVLAVGITIAGGSASLPPIGGEQSTSTTVPKSTTAQTVITSIPTKSPTRTEIQTPKPTRKPTSTPTETATVWPTVTTQATSYEEFQDAMRFALEEESAVPVRFRGMRVVDNDLIFVVNYTTKSPGEISQKKQRSEILEGYAWAIYWHDTDAISGKIPIGLEILEVDNTGTAAKYTYASTDNTRKWINDEITDIKYIELVTLSIRNQTAEERELVDSIDREWENRTYHNKSEPLYPE
jgi:hypothetical protein